MCKNDEKEKLDEKDKQEYENTNNRNFCIPFRLYQVPQLSFFLWLILFPFLSLLIFLRFLIFLELSFLFLFLKLLSIHVCPPFSSFLFLLAFLSIDTDITRYITEEVSYRLKALLRVPPSLKPTLSLCILPCLSRITLSHQLTVTLNFWAPHPATLRSPGHSSEAMNLFHHRTYNCTNCRWWCVTHERRASTAEGTPLLSLMFTSVLQSRLAGAAHGVASPLMFNLIFSLSFHHIFP